MPANHSRLRLELNSLSTMTVHPPGPPGSEASREGPSWGVRGHCSPARPRPVVVRHRATASLATAPKLYPPIILWSVAPSGALITSL